nr:hypothetical protein [Arthrobacter sp. ES3-54]
MAASELSRRTGLPLGCFHRR